MVKHVIWKYWFGDKLWRGRVAVRLESEMVKIVRLVGKPLPAPLLRHTLRATIPNFEELAKKAHLTRKYPWRVDVRYGYSGCVDYKIRILRDEELLDQPVAVRVHVSSSWKLDEKITLWIGDLFVLLDQIDRDFPIAAESQYRIEVIEPELKEYFQPGIESRVRRQTAPCRRCPSLNSYDGGEP